MKKCALNRVLIADDDPGCRQVYSIIVMASFPAAEVDHAPNGEEAFALFSEHHYSVVVMDVHMPIEEGTSSCKRISAYCLKEDWEEPLIILLSHFVPPHRLTGLIDERRSARLLSKPARSDELISTLRLRLSNK